MSTDLIEFSVTGLSQALKKTIETTFGRVCVRGEISGGKQHSSGHFYFVLKDDQSTLDSVCWRGTLSRLSVQPEEGMEVLCIGRLTTYPGRSKYQLIIDSLSLAGHGAILRILEERKKKLLAEGLFDEKNKKALPFLPKNIGLITSITGAVIQDILHRLEDRFPRSVYLWPVLVQGPGAAEEIARAIQGMNRLSAEGKIPYLDLLIVARGGGTLEDLWAFNEEIVVRAAAASHIPLISAVGHETDTTLIDYAADYRAPTPTAAAEKAVPVRKELQNLLTNIQNRLHLQAERFLRDQALNLRLYHQKIPPFNAFFNPYHQRIDEVFETLIQTVSRFFLLKNQQILTKIPALKSPQHLLDQKELRIDSSWQSFQKSIKTALQLWQLRLEKAADLLESFSHKKILKRGFCFATNEQGAVQSAAYLLKPGSDLTIHFWDGQVKTAVKKVHQKEGNKPDN